MQPFALTTPRRVAIPLMNAVKEELTRMQKLGVISKVTETTEWCAGMVVVPKKNNKVRICVDLTKLNQSVKRECHPLPAVEQALAHLGSSQNWTGFWQIPLSASLALLTTFITPSGRLALYNIRSREKDELQSFWTAWMELVKGVGKFRPHN